MKLPFPRSYWVEPGRLLAGFFPGDRDPRLGDEKIHALLDCGVSYVLNLMEPGELDHSGQPFVQYELRFRELARQSGRNFHFERRAIVDRSIPTAQHMRETVAVLKAALAQNHVTYVHCWGGRGRTGTVIGCYLKSVRGLTGENTLALLKNLTAHNPPAFWPAPEMPVQQQFIRDWEDVA